MLCNYCKLRIPYDKAPRITHCTICGNPLTPQSRDILEYGLYGITKEVRQSQIKMAMDIEDLFKQQAGTLLAEGQTGTGKTFAYLIPALLHEDKRVIISTAKTALQDQLCNKDLPLLCKKMGYPQSTFGIYKGRNHYLCRQLVDSLPTREQETCRTFMATYPMQHIDKANWPGDNPPYWWSQVSTENCPEIKGCEHKKYCRPSPHHYRICIVNHSLLGIDLKIGKAHGILLGPYDTIIMDEGHQAAEYFHDVYTTKGNTKTLDTLTKRLSSDDDLAAETDNHPVPTWNTCVLKSDHLKKSFKKLYQAALAIRTSDKLFSPEILTVQVEKVNDDAEMLSHYLTVFRRALEDAVETEEEDSSEAHRLKVLISRIKRYLRTVDNFIELSSALLDTDIATPRIVQVDDNQIDIKPIHIGPLLHPKLKGVRHRVLTSATLAMGNDFSNVIDALGIPTEEPTSCQVYPSPFRVKNRTILYLPQHIPKPEHTGKPPEVRRNWVDKSATEIAQIVDALRGDTFVLFNSKVDMNDHIERLAAEDFWRQTGLTLCAQTGAAQPTLRKYMENKHSVLFGLKSFWEGVDVPGPKLKMVVIPRLPFPNLNDPLLKAQQAVMDKKYGRKVGFNKIVVPRMITDMRQAVGRLLRAYSDRGFVAITDPRIWTATSNEELHVRRMDAFKQHPDLAKRTGYAKLLLDILDLPNQTPDFNVIAKWAEQWFNIEPN